MYFTSTPSLNSMEAIMQRPFSGNQRGRRQAPQGVHIPQSGLRLQALPQLQKKERLLHGGLPGVGCQTLLRRCLSP